MFKLSHAQATNGDEVADGTEAARGTLGVLEQADHGFDVSVAAMLDHAAHHRIFELGGEFLERFEATALCPAQSRFELGAGLSHFVVLPGAGLSHFVVLPGAGLSHFVVLPGAGMRLARRRLEPLGTRARY